MAHTHHSHRIDIALAAWHCRRRARGAVLCVSGPACAQGRGARVRATTYVMAAADFTVTSPPGGHAVGTVCAAA